MSTPNNLTEKQIRKREYNKRAREKAKLKHEEMERASLYSAKSKISNVSNYLSNVESPEIVTLDKETYEYLLERAKGNVNNNTENETVQKETKPEENFTKAAAPTFTQMVKQNTMGVVASIVPILAIQGVIHGARLLKNQGSRSTQEESYVMPKSSLDPYSMNHY